MSVLVLSIATTVAFSIFILKVKFLQKPVQHPSFFTSLVIAPVGSELFRAVDKKAGDRSELTSSVLE